MARLIVSEPFDFGDILEPDEVMDQMLEKAADVVAKSQKQTAKSMLSGKYSTGELAESIQKGKISGSGQGKAIKIGFKGSRRRYNTTTRNAEIAYINEFGKRGQPARPFIDTANKQCENETFSAAEEVFDNWLSSKGF